MTSAPTTPPAATGTRNIRSIMAVLGMLPVLILLMIGFHLYTGRFLTGTNMPIVLQIASINMVLAAGMTFVILTGGIDLSVGSILAVAAMVSVLISMTPEIAWLAVPAGLLVGLACGLFNGSIIAFVQLPPFIVTLGSLTALRGIARLIGKDETLFNADMGYAYLGNGTVFGVPFMAIIAFLTILISWFVLKRTVLGNWIYAVGGNADAARLTGIKVPYVLLFVYGIAGLLSGLAAVLYSAQIYSANGSQAGVSYELDAIAAVILGGTSFVGGIGSIWGTLIGAMIIAVLTNGLIQCGVPDIWQSIIKGAIIIVAVMLDRFRQASGART